MARESENRITVQRGLDKAKYKTLMEFSNLIKVFINVTPVSVEQIIIVHERSRCQDSLIKFTETCREALRCHPPAGKLRLPSGAPNQNGRRSLGRSPSDRQRNPDGAYHAGEPSKNKLIILVKSQ